MHSHTLGDFQRRNIARLRQRVPQSDVALEFVVVVVGRVRTGASHESGGGIQNQIVGRGAERVYGRGVNIRLE